MLAKNHGKHRPLVFNFFFACPKGPGFPCKATPMQIGWAFHCNPSRGGGGMNEVWGIIDKTGLPNSEVSKVYPCPKGSGLSRGQKILHKSLEAFAVHECFQPFGKVPLEIATNRKPR